MIYNCFKAGDNSFFVGGIDDEALYGLTGFTEGQAREIAFHLNTAYERGQRDNQSAVRKVLGLADATA